LVLANEAVLMIFSCLVGESAGYCPVLLARSIGPLRASRDALDPHCPVAFAMIYCSAPGQLRASRDALDPHCPVAFAMISFDTCAGTSAYESNTIE
jgi:hypothetical protein